ncbi:hypothetical protein CPB84DRAFT_1673109 [Gymnopilus junonius]|uniref:Uncharacterized protein n=1 Tax=Gymnopilus junonius TaxID=109634 RepID=A0A9P5NZH8_GYMJU|nr:hypothetical protein CPB84DRAFT_1673109 [Gymnopilus junonius]
MDALSSEWRLDIQYRPGDRVAFKLANSMGAAAFECLIAHVSKTANQQPTSGDNAYWKHYPRGFPRQP